VSAARAAIDEANVVILTAKTAIEDQAGNTYTIQVNTEEELKTDVGRAKQALRDDLASVRSAVKAARDAIRESVTTLARSMQAFVSTSTPEPEETENDENEAENQ